MLNDHRRIIIGRWLSKLFSKNYHLIWQYPPSAKPRPAYNWSKNNKLYLNLNKCFFITFTRKQLFDRLTMKLFLIKFYCVFLSAKTSVSILTAISPYFHILNESFMKLLNVWILFSETLKMLLTSCCYYYYSTRSLGPNYNVVLLY